ncbi:hypothetical protein [Chryseobacterium carnipullorum]|uniref:hypothetical protein n=1 Tax=Chryseobacterium carnipullorum TaxID=1124835 RepID=UPI000E9EB11B|nr:hypothetical protein [Chryseobacterium carnipullorum]HBV14839.1 hypothetical protein [Chryseobacterium carnipullorum]
MRIIVLFIIALLSNPLYIKAQESQKIADLKVPSSPAASILEIVPGTILQPKSYQALEAAIYSNFATDNKLKLPDNFSLEFTPYWFKDHGLSLKDYLGKPTFTDQLKRNSSFSLASTQSYFLSDSTKTSSLAIGYRTSFFLGSKKDDEKVAALLESVYLGEKIVTQILPLAIVTLRSNPSTGKDFMDQLEPDIEESLLGLKISKEVIKEFSKALRNEIEKTKIQEFNTEKLAGVINSVSKNFFKMESDYKELKEYINNRYGFYLDMAYANFINFPTNNFEFSIVPKQSVWLTPSYRFADDLKNFKLIGVIRYQWNNTDYFGKYFPDNKLYKNNFDYGIAVNGKFDKFSAHVEVIGRQSNTDIIVGKDSDNNILYRKNKESDVQYLGTLSYRLTDQVVLSYSLGKNFEIVSTNENNLISLLALNFGFGAPTALK